MQTFIVRAPPQVWAINSYFHSTWNWNCFEKKTPWNGASPLSAQPPRGIYFRIIVVAAWNEADIFHFDLWPAHNREALQIYINMHAIPRPASWIHLRKKRLDPSPSLSIFFASREGFHLYSPQARESGCMGAGERNAKSLTSTYIDTYLKISK